MVENKESIKISSKAKEFLKQMKVNRIKLDLEPINYSEGLEIIANYFKNNNDRYLEMLKEVQNVRST